MAAPTVAEPSCGAISPTPPEWKEERTVKYLEDMRDRARARNIARRERRGRNRRGRGMPRQEGRRDRDQERAREEARRQRDREDRANRDRRGPKTH